MPAELSPVVEIRPALTVTPPLPDEDQAAAQVKGRKRYEGFVETLGRRFASGAHGKF